MLAGRYEIVRRIASGGTSEVFLTRDLGDAQRRPAAVKRLFAHFVAVPELRDMFDHEARVLAALAHPAVPRLYGTGRDGPAPLIALEYVEGTALATLAAPAGGATLPLARSLAVVRQVLDGLAHVHARRGPDGAPLGIVHRDVTPQNVLVTRDGAAKLIDFGIATSAMRGDDTAGRVRGTPGYVAPEAITGEFPVDHRADLFAVGVVLYELTVGARLYGGDAVASMTATVEGEVPHPAQVVPGYPAGLDAIVARALAKRPDERFASAGEMARALAAVAPRA